MAEITDLDELSGELPSEAEIHAIIRNIDIQIANVLRGKGTLGAADFTESGPMGFSIAPSKLLAQLRQLRKMYVDALNDPSQFDDVDYIVSQFDNPGL